MISVDVSCSIFGRRIAFDLSSSILYCSNVSTGTICEDVPPAEDITATNKNHLIGVALL